MLNSRCMYPIFQIAHIVEAYKSRIIEPEMEIIELVYDSRKASHGRKGLFFALSGARDGHYYIDSAYKKGIRNFVLSCIDFCIDDFPEANFLWVENTYRAIQALAGYHRGQFDFPIIGITGSNGKTVVKEWLYELLSDDKRVYQSPKSYNSQLGVALSLWELDECYDIALIEAGISARDEMAKLERMIRPDVGILTSIGVAHAEGFDSQEEKLREKLKLFSHSKSVVYSSRHVTDGVFSKEIRLFSWGDCKEDNLYIQNIHIEMKGAKVTVLEEGSIFIIPVPFTDMASIENVLTCVSVMRYLGYEWQAILERVQVLKAIEMRLQLKKGVHNCSIIDDSYSNDLGSLKIALDFFDQQRQHAKKTVILSEMVGVSDDLNYGARLFDMLSFYSFDRLIWVGGIKSELKKLPVELLAFADIDELLGKWSELVFSNETILIKGARKFQLEKLVRKLTAKSHGTVLEINLNAIENNLKVYRSLLPHGVKLMAMVKAFSYGSGSFEVANMLQYNHVDYLTVAFVDEGVELRQGGITLPIMVLSPDLSGFDNMVSYNLEPEIYSFGILRAFLSHLGQQGIDHYPVHIKLDTGMHRLGFMPEELDELMVVLKETDRVRVQSVFSHLVASGDVAHDTFTQKQVALFEQYVSKIELDLGYPVIKHLANTSAIVRWPDASFEMVRLGIGLYGVDLTGSINGILPTSVLKTTVTQVKALPTGDTVGYDRKGVLQRDSLIATVKIGYADGYDRRFGNGAGQMQWGGIRVPTIGNVCMDMCMLDVTGLDVQEGDEVLVFPDLVEAAERIGAIPYELLVNISSRVKRVYYYE